MPSSPSPKDLQTLRTQTTTLSTLLTHYLSLLSPTTAAPTPPPTLPPNPPPPLPVLADAAKLLKAHTTKLGLLLLNKPFSPTAIAKILAEISATCLPAMMSAVQICAAQREVWGAVMVGEVRARVRRVVVEVKGLVREVESQVGEATRAGSSNGVNGEGDKREGRDALTTTGWLGLVVKKAEQYRATLLDAVAELKEWGEDEGDNEVDREEETWSGDDEEDDFDNAFDAPKLPRDQKELRAQLEAALKKLKVVGMLYQALVKRRLKTFPFSGTTSGDWSGDAWSMGILDEVMETLKSIPESVDDLASAFYELDGVEAKKRIEECCKDAVTAKDLVIQNWEEKMTSSQLGRRSGIRF
ncbi:hypothetical protein H2199_002918 [Coniosporium tulheliwenetii]|uniref:Uncharacterized protein n=1 Tax=Coniosporium tulheliwenetii TaxID=3383036 RepID=A0ACC2ZEI6_9PEZI|nr:hypothetical protein H2199_002918 [Cladosporium sp. JES 115]